MTRFLCPAVFALVIVGGCLEAPRSEPVGYVQVALTAPAGGGSIYRLPPALLQLSTAGINNSFSLDGDAATVTLHVPPGTYDVSLIQLGGSSAWSLIREDPDGSTVAVPATLDLTPTITVAGNQTTPLVIRFHIPSVGPISFDVGTVEVSVVVDGTPASSVVIEIMVPSLVAGSVGYGTTIPAALRAELPALGSAGDSFGMSLQTTGAWVLTSPGTVCAPMSMGIATAGSPGFSQLVTEAFSFGDKQFCLQQGDSPQASGVVLFDRTGPGRTPLLADRSPRYSISMGVIAIVTADVFDGATLHLESLLGTVPALVGIFGDLDAQIGTQPDGNPLSDRWYTFSESGNGTIGLTPQ